jgi:methylmalonyl-CoA/ethylmalonyl-CoA epimerase
MTDAAPALRLHHVGTSVPDLDAAVAWYCDTLGFARDYTYEIPEPQARVAFLRLGDCRIELFEVAGSAPMPAAEGDVAAGLRQQGLKHFTLATGDLDASMRALAARGIAFVTPATEVPDSGGERWAFFRDPNGLLIELFQPVRP